jgi:plasmid stability protein
VRTTFDIPDETYRALKIKAATEGTSVRQIILRGVTRELAGPKQVRKFEIPIVRSSRPGTLELTNEQIDDILFSS